MTVRPLSAALALAAGIAAARIVGGPALAWWALAAIAVASRRATVVGVVAAGLALGARERPSFPGADDRTLDRVVGTVGAAVVRTPRGAGATLDTGDAVVWVWADAPLRPGERVAVTGYVHSPRGLLDPAMVDRADQLAARGADYEVTARSVDPLADEPAPIDIAWRWGGAIQQRWARAIDDAGGDPVGAAALRGIITGDRGDVPPALDQRWRALGIYHVLSVSGLHLAVVAGLVYALLRRLVAASPWGGRTRPARWAAPPALAIAVAYTAITGAQLATIRSLVVVCVMLVGAMLDRPARLVDALGVGALVLLIWRPADLYDPSFQLSFTAALTLALRPSAPGKGARHWVARGLVTSAWVALTTAPITAYHFHQVAAGGLVGNLVLTPVLELVALPVGLAGLVVGEVWPGLGALLVDGASRLVGVIDAAAGLLARITPVGTIAVASAAVMAILVALSVWLASRARRDRRDIVAWIALCLTWAAARTPPPPGALRVTFLDVGQGDAAIVELPDGAVWIVDAGGNASARDLASGGAPGRAIARVLEAYGHDHIDLAIVSHPHPDHYLGLAALAGTTPIDALWTAHETPGDAPAEPGFAQVARMLATAIDNPPLGVARREAGVELVVWGPRYQASPAAAVVEATDPVRTVNDNSLVVSIAYRGRTLLFTGDIEREGEDALVAAGIGGVDVVKVPHHGSPTSSSAGLVAATHPALAVISCGAGNHFGFPSPAVVARWRAAGADVARTDTDGAIEVTVDGSGELHVVRFRPP